MKTDVLVIGSGIAGLSFTIKTATARPDISVLVLTKNNSDVSNTAHAQGGIAVVLDKVRDSFEQHIEDTIQAGKSLNDRSVVEMVVSQAPERLMELISWGTNFDADDSGELQLGLEGGHSQHRIVHHRDFTGLELERKLLKKAESLSNVTFYDHYFVTDLLIEKTDADTVCAGVRALEEAQGQQMEVHSKITFLATGGSGMIFGNTTNPSVATADGVAMAHRAGAKVEKMNYFQFHPTALYEKGKHPLFLISEAVRGFGAYVVNQNGNRFLFNYDCRGELATRDIVSEAIVTELKKSGGETAFLDCRHLDSEAFRKHFPTIVAYCTSIGIDVRTDLIPIVPAAHYQCGGIAVDKFARTSIENLFASGECAHTGLHGANRLASNSLLEALVFSHQAASLVLKTLDEIPTVKPFLEVWKNSEEEEEEEEEREADNSILASLGIRLNELMTYELLNTATEEEQNEAWEQLSILKDILETYPPFNTGTVEFFELKNMVQTAALILEHSLKGSALSFHLEH